MCAKGFCRTCPVRRATYNAGMKSERLELRVEPVLKARVVAECERRGMKVATFVERALEAALAPVVSAPSRAPKLDVPLVGRDVVQKAYPLPAGVKSARELAMDRQLQANRAREKKS